MTINKTSPHTQKVPPVCTLAILVPVIEAKTVFRKSLLAPLLHFTCDIR